MALRTLSALKAYFYEHAYPTWQQFHDVLDSFRHKSDTIAISEVEDLSTQLNDKVSQSVMTQEISTREAAETTLQTNIDNEASTRQQSYTTLSNRVSDETTDRIAGDGQLASALSDVSSALSVIQTWKAAMTDADSDNIINTLTELLDLAKNVPEGTDLAALLAAKVSTSDIVNNLTSVLTSVPLSAYQGNVLKGLIDTLNDTVLTHTGNTDIHITAAERTKWNSETITRDRLPIGTLLSNQTVDAGEWLSGFTVDTTTGVFTKENHGFVAYSIIELRANGGTLPTGLYAYDNTTVVPLGYCYRITVIDANTFKLSGISDYAVVIPTDAGLGNWQMRSGLITASVSLPVIPSGQGLEIFADVLTAAGRSNNNIQLRLNNNTNSVYVIYNLNDRISNIYSSATGNNLFMLKINLKRYSNYYTFHVEAVGYGTMGTNISTMGSTVLLYGRFLSSEDVSSIQIFAGYPDIRSVKAQVYQQ